MTDRHRKPRDWFKTGVHFACGTMFGFFIGMQVTPQSFLEESSIPEPIIIGSVALFVGLLAATTLDRFWASLRR